MLLRNLRSVVCVVFILLFTSVALAQDARSISAQRAKDEKKLQEYFTQHNIHPLKAYGIYYVINKEGVGRQILAGETVTLNYTGKFLDGKKFDSNTDPAFHHAEPFVVEIGANKVIRGWDKGVQLLKKGTAATLYIPSGLAYGPDGGPVPPNSVLIFDMEILDARR